MLGSDQVRHYQLGPMLTQDLLSGINALPTLPGVLTKILQTLEDQWSSAQDLESIIRNDQSLSSKMLAASNSAYYGFPQQITTVHRAALVLGYDEVRKICMGAGLVGFMQKAPAHDRALSEELWRHSLSVAEASRLLAQRQEAGRGPDTESAFTAGLLHDLGKVVLVAFFPEAAKALMDLTAREDLTWRQAEEVLELDHQDIGLYLAEHWNLPPMLGEVMGRHHEPDPSLKFLPMVLTVHLADWLTHDLKCEQQDLDPIRHTPEIMPEASERLGLTVADLQACRARLAARADSLEELWQAMQAG